MAEIINFREAKSRALSVFNPLEAWKLAFVEELTEHGCSISVPADFFPNSKVDDSKNLYQLNNKIEEMRPGDKLILMRNYHFELFFYYSYEKKLTLRIGTLTSGIDAVLLQNRFSDEKKIFKKYYQLMLEYFGNESSRGTNNEKDGI